MELAKYNPTSPLLHGAPQREYGLLLQKSKKLKQQHSEMEEELQELHLKRDLMVMDLEATKVALRYVLVYLHSDRIRNPTWVANVL
jgi:hypothetical protein